MRRLHQIFRSARRERGGVLLIVALCMPVLIGFTGLVLDVGNWFEHRRHLQTQADAAVLAAAGDVRFPCDASVNSAIAARIQEYGKDAQPAGRRNAAGQGQVGAQLAPLAAPDCRRRSRRHDRGRRSAVRGQDDRRQDDRARPAVVPQGRSAWSTTSTSRRGSACSAKTRQTGSLPIGVPDVNPRAVRVWFVDETTSPATEVPGSSKLLKRRNDADGNPVFQNGLTIWDNAADNAGTSLPLKVEHSKLGMRVALSQDASTTDCANPAVKCYDAGSSNGLLFVRGHATTPVVNNGNAPAGPGRVAALRHVRGRLLLRAGRGLQRPAERPRRHRAKRGVEQGDRRGPRRRQGVPDDA